MKTSKSKLKNLPIILAFILTCGTGFSQKSIDYQSVGTNLEEIASFFENTCQFVDKVSTEVEIEMKLVKQEQANEIIVKVVDWSEIHLKDLNEAARETKIWLSKQHFAPVKKSKHVHKDLAEKSAD